MTLLRQVAIILGICLAGELLNNLLNIPIPGNVLGMILLLLLLVTGVIKLEMIDKITKFLLEHLAFFFVPAGIGLLSNLELIKDQWFAIIVTITISTVLVMVVTGLTVQFLMRRWSA
ncbi:CidA/LrgA family protein [Natronincola ferrireducens]|uniref:Holin-like protein n=1 Tax=Natronincola ferrireducens TaxID=393762 RepID=A0A1G9F7A7_9FIRM|nr:CidA/LrgA family protein [Natronincola ferrireducens]SDK84284.1 holin-like protein [Natronincola ferrireducens]